MRNLFLILIFFILTGAAFGQDGFNEASHGVFTTNNNSEEGKIMKKLIVTIVMICLFLMPNILNAGCTHGCLESLYKRFDYWMKTYDHRGDSHSESFAKFPSYDDAILFYGADYKDYKALAEMAKKIGKYKIEWVIGESGFFSQISYMKKGLTENP